MSGGGRGRCQPRAVPAAGARLVEHAPYRKRALVPMVILSKDICGSAGILESGACHSPNLEIVV